MSPAKALRMKTIAVAAPAACSNAIAGMRARATTSIAMMKAVAYAALPVRADLRIDEQRDGGQCDEEGRRERGSVDARGRLPATEPDESEGAERHGGDEGDDGEVDAGPASARYSSVHRPAPANARPRQQRPVAQTARSIRLRRSTMAMKPNNAQWFGACEATSSGVT